MRKFLIKALAIMLAVYIPVMGVNYMVDPAHLYNNEILDNASRALLSGQVIESLGDIDEGLFQKRMTEGFEKTPETVIVGSSHIMYLPWEYEDCYVMGLSGAYMGDYYAAVGLLEEACGLPEHLVLGIDSWAFEVTYDNGRHRNVIPYAERVHDRVTKSTGSRVRGQTTPFTKIREWKELTSFSYFQTSLNYLIQRGPSFYFSGESQAVHIVESPAEGMAVMLPDGRRVMSSEAYQTVEAKNAAAQGVIGSGCLYLLGEKMPDINRSNYEDFELLLEYLLEKGVEVEIYLPSWYPVFYDYFESNASFAGVMAAEEAIRATAAEYGLTVHGSYNPYACGLTAENFADSMHLRPEKMLENYSYVRE